MQRRKLNPAHAQELFAPPRRPGPRTSRVYDENPSKRALDIVHEDRKGGRPTSYRPEFDDLVFELRLAAVPIEGIARILNVSVNTLYVWQNSKPTFNERWEAGGDIADSRVAVALYTKATGFSRYIQRASVNKTTGEVLNYEEEQYYPPDTTAGIFWMTNRKKHHWQSSSKQEVSGPNGTPLNPPSIHVNFTKADTPVEAE